jgi:hypothetical protein
MTDPDLSHLLFLVVARSNKLLPPRGVWIFVILKIYLLLMHISIISLQKLGDYPHVATRIADYSQWALGPETKGVISHECT